MGSTSQCGSATHPNNSQAKLTQFEMKIRFNFRGIYLSLSQALCIFFLFGLINIQVHFADKQSPADSRVID